MKIYSRVFKRIFDILISLILITLLIPVFIIISLLILLIIGRPILFKQKRPGKKEKIFTLYKFRTMNNLKDNKGNLLDDIERRTKFGDFLRKTSLDELPELINVLIGNMSLVGPRPLLVEYLEHYDDLQRKRHEVKPGITGLAQVKGRNNLSWEEKFQYDLHYISKITFAYDIYILLLTIKSVIKREGINNSDKITMDKFKGNLKKGDYNE